MPVISTIAAATARAFGAFKAAAGGAADEFFNYVTLLLHGDGTNGAQNNTFLDSSTNNFTITRNGNTTQGTFSPFSQDDGKWGAYFVDSGSSYLNIATNTIVNFGTGDFTAEAWVYLNTVDTSIDTLISNYNNGSNGGFGWYINRGTNGGIQLYSGNSLVVSASSAVTAGAWNHVAVCRASGTTRIFVNGTVAASASDSSNYGLDNSATGIAGTPPGSGAGAYFPGYMSNVRVVKGTAVYTSAFTPSTTPLTAITNTSLLTCQSNRFKDNSANNFAITVNGNTSIQPFSPFAPSAAYSAATNGGSGYFDGSGDYLTCNQVISTADFSIEAWVYPTSFADIRTIFSQGTAGTAGRTALYITTGGLVALQITTTYVYGSTSLKLNSWNHVAVTRSSGAVTVYLNGVSDGTGTIATTVQSTSSTIGEIWGTGDPFIGYMSSLRVSDTARTISLPSAPYTSDGNTELLLNFTNAGILDNTGRNDLETVGNAQISTSVKKFGTGSLAFDGSGDYLQIPNNESINLGTGDFTIEFWVYPNVGNTDFRGLITKRASSFTGTSWRLAFTDGTYVPNLATVSHSSGVSAPAATVSTWNHVAFVRSNGTVTGYTNGVAGTAGTGWTESLSNTDVMIIGSNSGVSLNGYIDDLRITKGVARYTSNFTPPTAAFEDQ